MYEAELNEHRNSQLDWPLLLATVGLMVIGAAFVFSATSVHESEINAAWYQESWLRQIFWCAMGLGAATVLCMVDYIVLARWSMVLYWAIIILLALVFLSQPVNGARRWINLAGFTLQPSEFAKIAVILVQANFLSRPVEELRMADVFWKSLGLAVLPFVMILGEPDLGSALVLIPVTLGMMFVAGVPRRFLGKVFGGLGLVAALFVAAVFFAPHPIKTKLANSYQGQRLLTYFGRDFAPRNVTPEERNTMKKLQDEKAYNVKQSLISVGSGGLWGKGWRQGTQYALGFLPRLGAHNDFIFSVIAEEEGFIGSLVVLGLYTVLLFSGIKTASQSRDRLGKLMAIGVVMLFFTHVFINIGMNIRLMPVTGIPLPLLSYGGSSVVCSLIAIGILLNIHIHRRSY
jgi:rod shape determining protein RodA